VSVPEPGLSVFPRQGSNYRVVLWPRTDREGFVVQVVVAQADLLSVFPLRGSNPPGLHGPLPQGGEGLPSRLLSRRDAKGRPWLRLLVELGEGR